jgi:hypothetical protein
MVSKASELFPEPDTPLITVSLPCGISQERFFRLCVRALRIMMASSKGKAPEFRVRALHRDPQRAQGTPGHHHYKLCGNPRAPHALARPARKARQLTQNERFDCARKLAAMVCHPRLNRLSAAGEERPSAYTHYLVCKVQTWPGIRWLADGPAYILSHADPSFSQFAPIKNQN